MNIILTMNVAILQIKYGSSVQLGLLRLLSEGATQRFTYYCSGSVAWFDQSASGHDSAVILRGDNDYEFETSKFSFQQVVHDGCRVSLVRCVCTLGGIGIMSNIFKQLFES